MSEPTSNADSTIDPLQSLIADFLDAEGKGQPLDREAWLAGHADHAASLREFLANHDRMRKSAQPPIHGSVPDSATMPPPRHGQDDATLPVDVTPLSRSREASVGDRVRYFGDYELLEEIARGGMGVVYKAKQINLNRIVALKMILAGQLASDQDVQRFRTEAEAAANLDHPRIVPIFEVGQHAGQHYFSMGFVDGQSLAQKVIDGPMVPRDAAAMLVKICEGISYAHQRGVIHRDLKPANILLDQNEQPKVTDFGLAKQLGSDSNLTGTGQILGTPSYMAPEQASGKVDEVGPLADVYSLGAILYCLLTGRPPFQAANPMDTLLQVLDKEPIPPTQLNSTIPVDLETICLKCLSKEPHRRFPTANELSQELGRFLRGEPILARPVGRLEHSWRWCRRNPAVSTLSAVVLASLIAGISISTLFAIQARQQAEKLEVALTTSQWRLYANQIANAQNALQSGGSAVAIVNLSKTEEKLRGWEYRFLKNLSQLNQLTISVGDAPTRNQLVPHEFSPDGKLVCALWSRCGVWNALTGESILELNLNVLHASFSPDSKKLLICCADPNHSIKIIDIATQKVEVELAGHKGPLARAYYHPTGRMISSVGAETLCIWDLSTGKISHSVPCRLNGRNDTGRFSPDGSSILAFGEDSALNLWDVSSGSLKRSIPNTPPYISTASFSPSGKSIVCTSQQALRVFDLDQGTEKFSVAGRFDNAVFQPDGRGVYAFRWNVIESFDAETGRSIRKIDGPAQFRNMVIVSPDGSTFAADNFNEDRTYSSSTITVWKPFAPRQSLTLRGHTGRVNCVAFGPDGKQVVSASADKSIVVWDAKNGELLRTLKGHEEEAFWCEFSSETSEGSRVISVSGKPFSEVPYDVRIWDAASGNLILSKRDSYRTASFSPDGKQIISIQKSGGGVEVWDSRSGNVLAARSGTGTGLGLSAARFSPSGRQVAMGGYDGGVELWDNVINKVTQRFGRQPLNAPEQVEQYVNTGMPDCIRDVTFSSDGEKIVMAVLALTNPADLGKVTVIDPSTGKVVLKLLDSEKITKASYSPDGTRILTLSSGDMLKLWDAASGRETFSLPGVTCAAFSPDSQRLAIGLEDRTVQILDASQSVSPAAAPAPQSSQPLKPALVESKIEPNVTPQRATVPKFTQEQRLTRARLLEIYQALNNYHEEFQHLPRPAVLDDSGKSLLSWRVALLPFLKQEDLYRKFKLDEAWDSEHNQKVLMENPMPDVYKDPWLGSNEEKTTRCQLFVGEGATFETDKRTRWVDIRDGMSFTIPLALAAKKVPWTKPEDMEFKVADDPRKLLFFRDGRGNILFADGRHRDVLESVSEERLKALITRAGHESIDLGQQR